MENPTIQNQMSLAEAARILRAFVQHPNVRCFNYAEYVAASQAIQTVDSVVASQTARE